MVLAIVVVVVPWWVHKRRKRRKDITSKYQTSLASRQSHESWQQSCCSGQPVSVCSKTDM